MSRKTTIFFTPLTIFILVCLMIIRFPDNKPEIPVSDEPNCKENPTCIKPEKSVSDDLMLENLSQQFILISSFN